MANGTYSFMSNGDGWARELFFMFTSGALVASLFWLAVWHFQARPAQADALQEREAVVRDLENSSRQCESAKQSLADANQRLELEVEQLDRQLKQAWAAHARCLRGN